MRVRRRVQSIFSSIFHGKPVVVYYVSIPYVYNVHYVYAHVGGTCMTILEEWTWDPKRTVLRHTHTHKYSHVTSTLRLLYTNTHTHSLYRRILLYWCGSSQTCLTGPDVFFVLILFTDMTWSSLAGAKSRHYLQVCDIIALAFGLQPM